MTWYANIPVLIVGGAGFIGSHLCERLVELGARVTVMDNLSTGDLENLAAVKDNINFIKADINNYQSCLEATLNQRVVFHLGAVVSVPESVQKPHLCHGTNVNGTFNLLQSCFVNRVERFVFSSSAAVYGEVAGICSETMPCCATSPYGFSKYMGELYCQQFAKIYGLKTVCLRYFNVYGERQDPDGPYAAVVAKFQECMAANQPITIFGDGLQTRDFIPVHEVVDANLTLALLPKSLMTGQAFNVATGDTMNLFDLINLLKVDYPDWCGDIDFEPARAGDIKHSSADVTKLAEALERVGNNDKKNDEKTTTV